ncbi:DUF3300 domain-containing protein [Chitinibacteraceae bacterium HSL-7]
MLRRWLSILMLCCAVLPLAARAAQSNTYTPEQLEQLAAPIALYPDSLLAQIMMAATYPLEVVEAARWSKGHPEIKDKALDDAMTQQSWDPSVKSLTAFPSVLQMMNDKLDWTQQLGDAVLADQSGVMVAVQRLRVKAQANGNLQSSKEQTVTTDTSGSTTVIQVVPAQPETVYVPVYNPTVVYGPWPYPYYTPFYWYPPGYVYASNVFSFTAGVLVGAALWGAFDWHHSHIDIDINRYNHFSHTKINSNRWEHNASHRKGVPYRNSDVAQRFNKGQLNNANSREAFRGRVDAERGKLQGGDQAAIRDRVQQVDRQDAASKLGNVDRAAAEPRLQNVDRQATQDRVQQMNRGNRGEARDSAFSGMDRGQRVRNESRRGASSRGSMQFQPHFGGGRVGGRR